MRRTRSLLVLVAVTATLAAAGFALPAAEDLILYNHTPSTPIGLYVRTEGPIQRGAFATVRAADVAPAAARRRGFDGPRDRFIKRVAAIGGDHVCTYGTELLINGAPAATRLERDGQGAQLPAWMGCRTLGADEILLLGDTPYSFDGRYWGPVRVTQIEGVWRQF